MRQWTTWAKWTRRSLASASHSTRSHRVPAKGRRRLFFEPLEGRVLLAADAPACGNPVTEQLQGTNVVGPDGTVTRYFQGCDALHGTELWKSDGTASGTRLVADIRPGTASSNPSYLTAFQGNLFFQADDGIHGSQLWESDGTPGGTQLVAAIGPVTRSASPKFLVNVNGTLFFQADDAIAGAELWRSDGTLGGTTIVKDIRTGTASSNPSYLTNVNGKLYFQADDGVHGAQLWKSDGTPGGTNLVAPIGPVARSASPTFLANVNGTLFFQADDWMDGAELWRSNGTPGGTNIVKDIRGGAASSNPSYLDNVKETLYFQADDGLQGAELWRSDGTLGGTNIVNDIRVGPSGSNPSYLTTLGDTLYFQADDGLRGAELWKLKDPAIGPVLVKDIRVGTEGSNPSYLTTSNGTLYFQADDGVHGLQLWMSDGTEAGTKPTAFVVPDMPEIVVQSVVQGRGQDILNGKSNPLPGDGTEFSAGIQNAIPPTRTFTVWNSGAVPLTVAALTVPNGFEIAKALSGSIPPGGSDNFIVSLVTDGTGTFGGEIRFANNDGDGGDGVENPFHFAIAGRVFSRAENPWHNTSTPCDVNRLEGVTPLDVLIVINYINSHSNDGALPAPSETIPSYGYDVLGGAAGEGDGQVTALDVLAVINYLNGHSVGTVGQSTVSPEGEAVSPLAESAPVREALVLPTSPSVWPTPIHGQAVSATTAGAVVARANCGYELSTPSTRPERGPVWPTRGSGPAVPLARGPAHDEIFAELGIFGEILGQFHGLARSKSAD